MPNKKTAKRKIEEDFSSDSEDFLSDSSLSDSDLSSDSDSSDSSECSPLPKRKKVVTKKTKKAPKKKEGKAKKAKKQEKDIDDSDEEDETLSREELLEEKRKQDQRLRKEAKKRNAEDRKRKAAHKLANMTEVQHADYLLTQAASIRARYDGLINSKLLKMEDHPLRLAVPRLRQLGETHLQQALEIISNLNPQKLDELWALNGRNKNAKTFEELVNKREEQYLRIAEDMKARLQKANEAYNQTSGTSATTAPVSITVNIPSHETPVIVNNAAVTPTESATTQSAASQPAANPTNDPLFEKHIQHAIETVMDQSSKTATPGVPVIVITNPNGTVEQVDKSSETAQGVKDNADASKASESPAKGSPNTEEETEA